MLWRKVCLPRCYAACLTGPVCGMPHNISGVRPPGRPSSSLPAYAPHRLKDHFAQAMVRLAGKEEEYRKVLVEEEHWFYERQLLWQAHGEMCRCVVDAAVGVGGYGEHVQPRFPMICNRRGGWIAAVGCTANLRALGRGYGDHLQPPQCTSGGGEGHGDQPQPHCRPSFGEQPLGSRVRHPHIQTTTVRQILTTV